MSISRRLFLAATGGAAGLCVLPGCTTGLGIDDAGAGDASGNPDLTPRPDLRTCAGSVDAGPATAVMPISNLVASPDYAFYVCRDAKGLYALTAVCTHQGCTVDVRGTQAVPSFRCPCHGSTYAFDGTLIQGVIAGQEPLAHLALCVTAEGQCTVDPSTIVPPSTRT
jgi:nitrite reductase/ring-hydroxylating ferredoxin subunit